MNPGPDAFSTSALPSKPSPWPVSVSVGDISCVLHRQVPSFRAVPHVGCNQPSWHQSNCEGYNLLPPALGRVWPERLIPVQVASGCALTLERRKGRKWLKRFPLVKGRELFIALWCQEICNSYSYGLMHLLSVTWHTGNPPPTVPGTQALASPKQTKSGFQVTRGFLFPALAISGASPGTRSSFPANTHICSMQSYCICMRLTRSSHLLT